ncbi:MAG: DUF4342 domain-containing protein [Peptostreptococcaceae bacterium]|nr:DUF4342 domain-containing protein [Peptostreptococcaceae bacterium]
MKITLEQIDFLRARANVSYKEAKEALEQAEGDMVEALVMLEKQNKVSEKKNSAGSKNEGAGFWNSLKNFFKRMNKIRFILKNENGILLNFPLTLAVVLAIFATPFVVVGLLVALFTGYRIQFKNESGKDMAVNKYFDKVSDSVKSMGEDLKSE